MQAPIDQKIQFPWQRGVAPHPGGLTDTGTPHDDTGNDTGTAPGQGARTPRVGTEVLINFIDNDIDHPMIVGCLYNGDDLPPYSAGVDSNINHPGTLSGIHSHGLDGQGYNQWQIDDSAAQLRMRLASSSQTSQLNLGHLIAQTPGTAQRGAYRGQGFELRSDAHSVLRGGTGLLLTTTPRPGQGTSVTSTQLDAAESHAQLTSAADLTQAVYTAAAQQSAHTSLHTQQSQRDFTDTLKPAHDTQLPGQPYTRPAILLDSPASIAWISPASTAVSAAAQIHSTSQSDLHLAAAQTIASVAGNTTTLFTHSGGLQAIAAHGPLSLQAHTDALDILADQSVTVTSVNGRIDIKAKQKIVLHAGQSSITLEGANITFACPGKISIKGGVHGFKGGAGKAAELEGLPDTRVKLYDQAFVLENQETGGLLINHPYRIKRADGSYENGVTDLQGQTHLVSAADVEDVMIEIVES